MDLELAGKRCLVTGSSAGIGFSVATSLLREGAKVMLTARNRGRLIQAVKKLQACYGRDVVFSFAGDLTKADTFSRLGKEIKEKMKGLDVLVCNVGSGKTLSLLKETEQEWIRMLHTNLLGAEKAVRFLLPLLRRGQRPNMVFISSIAGHESSSAPLSYGAAKSGLNLFAKNLSRLLGKEGIRVNVVSPGNILFPGSVWETKRRLEGRAVRHMLAQEVPLGRLGNAEEIGDVVAFVASNRASFMNGAHIVVDGGQTRS